MKSADAHTCPQCGVMGTPVDGQTVKALLIVSLRLVDGAQYWFCATATCPIVYFAAGQTHAFSIDHVREPVFQKHPHDPQVRVCYCFAHTLGALETGTPADHAVLLADITAGIRAGQCACDLRNPQGSCCLGNVRQVIATHEALV